MRYLLSPRKFSVIGSLLCLLAVSVLIGFFISYKANITQAAVTPAFVQAASGQNSGGGNITTGAITTTSGNMLIAAVTWDVSGVAVTVSLSDSKSNVWTAATTKQVDTRHNQAMQIFYAKDIAGGSSHAVTATFSGSSHCCRSVIVHEVSGLDTLAPLDKIAVINNEAGVPVTVGPIVTAVSGEYIFGAVVNDSGSNTFSAVAPFVERREVASQRMQTEDYVQPTAGSISPAWTMSGTNHALAQVVSFKPGAGGPPDTIAPSVPTNVQASNVATSSVTLTWTASTDNVAIGGYRIFRNGVQIATTSSSTSYQNTGLTASTTYTYAVGAFDTSNNLSAQSSSINVTTLPPPDITPPTTPTNLQSSNVTASSLTLTWTASTDNVAVSGYKIFRNGIQIATTTTTSFGDTNLISNTTYIYTVRAYDAPGNVSAQSSSLNVTTASIPDSVPPSIPTNLSASAVSTSQINVTWNASTDNVAVAGYLVSRDGNQIATTTVPSFGNTGLASGTSYSYAVRAFDGAGNISALSSAASAITFSPDTISPTVPTNLQTSNVTSSSLTLSWAPATDNVAVAGYKIFRNGTQIATSSAVSFSDTGLTASTTYQYFVTAYDAAGNISAQSSTLFVTTQAAPSGPVAFPLKISSDHRYLADQNNIPFPILGRTAWFVIANNVADYTLFIDDTVARGFTAVEMHVINHDARGKNPPYAGNGTLPFLKQLDGANWDGGLNRTGSTAPDFSTPNEAYWTYVDAFLNYCQAQGIAVFFFPAYVGYQGGSQGWMQEMVANGPTKIQEYGTFLSNRYKNQPNLVWMMGGDMGTAPNAFNAAQTAVEDALITGLKSIQPQQSTLFSAEWDSESIGTDQTSFGSQMSLNGAYSHAGDVNTQGRRAYSYTPVEPSFLVEGAYDQEGPPDGAQWSPGNYYNSAATQPVRRFQWWATLSTIGGYITGNGFVWPFSDPNWKDHLDTQGSRDLSRMNTFIKSINWFDLVPSGLAGMKNLITVGGGTVNQDDYVSAAATPSGNLLVAYISPAHSGSITVDMTAMFGSAEARWYNPTDASYTTIAGSPFANIGTRQFTPPGNNGTGYTDWVLILEANVVPDTTSPSVPTNLSATGISSSGIALNWAASTDNVAVAGYKVFRGGLQIATTTQTNYTDNGLSVSTSYTYTVSAFDASGNVSDQSTTATGTTLSPDIIAPSVPQNLSAVPNVGQIALSWSASTDDSGIVAGYQVFRDSILFSTTTLTSFVDTGLNPAVTHEYAVAAYDWSGNVSSQSLSVSTTTPNTPSGIVAGFALNEGSGSITNSSYVPLTGTLVGSPAWTAGKYGNALNFSGTNYVNLGNPASLQLTGSITLSAWINISSNPWDDGAIIAKLGSNSLGWQLKTTPDTGSRTAAIQISSNGSDSIQRYSSAALALNTWYHIAGVYNASARTLDIYVNGVLNNGILSGTVPASMFNSTQNVNIAQRTGDPSTYNFRGIIDNVRVYNRVLNSSEIQADMNTPLP